MKMTSCTLGTGWYCQSEQYSSCSQGLWLFLSNWLVAPSRTGIRACLYFTWIRAISGLPQWLLPKAFKSKSIVWSSLGEGITVETRNRQPEKPWKKGVGKGSLPTALMYTRELRKLHACQELHTCSEKAWEDLSFHLCLIDLTAPTSFGSLPIFPHGNSAQ